MALDSKYTRALRLRSVPIQAVAEAFGLSVTPSGDRYVAACPFHASTGATPSLTLYPGQDRYYCFGCKASGSKAYFIAKMLEIPMRQVDALWKTGSLEHFDDLNLRLDRPEKNWYDEARLAASKWVFSMLRNSQATDDDFLKAMDKYFIEHRIISQDEYNSLLETWKCQHQS